MSDYAVIKNVLKTNTSYSIVGNEKPTIWKSEKVTTRGRAMGVEKAGDRKFDETGLVTGQDFKILWSESGNHRKNDEIAWYKAKVARQSRKQKRKIQRRFREQAISADDRERQMREVRCIGASGDSPQKRRSLRQSPEKFTSALLVVSQSNNENDILEITSRIWNTISNAAKRKWKFQGEAMIAVERIKRELAQPMLPALSPAKVATQESLL